MSNAQIPPTKSPGQNAPVDGSEHACEPERAIERLGGMRTLYASVVTRFLDDSAGNLARLRQAMSAGDTRLVRQYAHSLKGLAAMCGAVRVEEVLAELEAITSDSFEAQRDELDVRLDRTVREASTLLQPFREGSA